MFSDYSTRAFCIEQWGCQHKDLQTCQDIVSLNHLPVESTTWVYMCFIITVRNEVAKVMFLHMSVILSMGGVLSQHALQVVSQHALQQGGSAPGGCLLWGGLLQVGVPAPGGGCVDPPWKKKATVADGTHPTGMHSCCMDVCNEEQEINLSVHSIVCANVFKFSIRRSNSVGRGNQRRGGGVEMIWGEHLGVNWGFLTTFLS